MVWITSPNTCAGSCRTCHPDTTVTVSAGPVCPSSGSVLASHTTFVAGSILPDLLVSHATGQTAPTFLPASPASEFPTVIRAKSTRNYVPHDREVWQQPATTAPTHHHCPPTNHDQRTSAPPLHLDRVTRRPGPHARVSSTQKQRPPEDHVHMPAVSGAVECVAVGNCLAFRVP